MAWIETIDDASAKGLLARLYQGALQRAGRVFNVVRLQSINPTTLQASMGLYGAISLGESPLTRAQRELLAVVVSKTNDCHY